MLMGEAIVESLKESVNLVLIGFSPRKYYDCLAKFMVWACCRFIVPKLIVFGNISRELLSKEIKLQVFVHVGV